MTFLSVLIVIAAYIFTWHFSTYLIKRIVGVQKTVHIFVPDDKRVSADTPAVNIDAANQDERAIRDGYLIGKCENTIIFILVLADAFTGLALIFAAKNLVRKEAIQKNSGFFLVGTMVNFTVTLTIAFAVKYLLGFLH